MKMTKLILRVRALQQGVLIFSPRSLRLMGALGKTTAPAQNSTFAIPIEKIGLQKSCFLAIAPVLSLLYLGFKEDLSNMTLFLKSDKLASIAWCRETFFWCKIPLAQTESIIMYLVMFLCLGGLIDDIYQN